MVEAMMELPAEVPLVEIHSKASTSAASVVEEVVSPASSKISSAEVVPVVHKVPVSVALADSAAAAPISR